LRSFGLFLGRIHWLLGGGGLGLRLLLCSLFLGLRLILRRGGLIILWLGGIFMLLCLLRFSLALGLSLEDDLIPLDLHAFELSNLRSHIGVVDVLEQVLLAKLLGNIGGHRLAVDFPRLEPDIQLAILQLCVEHGLAVEESPLPKKRDLIE